MADESVPRREYDAAWLSHKDVHIALDSKVESVKKTTEENLVVQREQFSELKDIKWLVLIVVIGTMPHLIAFIKGLIHP